MAPKRPVDPESLRIERDRLRVELRLFPGMTRRMLSREYLPEELRRELETALRIYEADWDAHQRLIERAEAAELARRG